MPVFQPVVFQESADEEHPHSGVAVLISNGEDGDKVMNMGKQHAGETWKEATGNVEETCLLYTSRCV